MHDQRSTSLTPSIPAPGPALVLPGLLAVLHQYWLSVGTFAAILLIWTIQTGMILRDQRGREEALREREQAILTYAHTVTAFGQDPAPLVTALLTLAQQDDSYVVREDPPQGRLHRPTRGRW